MSSRHMEDVLDRSAASGSRARSASAISGSHPGSRPPRPSWASIHERPIQHRPFMAKTQFQRDQQAAAEGRLRHFPGRDEFAPRSRRLLMELALNRCSRDSVASASTMETQSAFTISSSGASRASRLTGARSQMSRSAVSVPSLSSAHSSQVEGGIAKRRMEAQFRSPALWEADRQWVQDKWAKDGPAGLANANFASSMSNNSMRNQGDHLGRVASMLPGIQEATVRGR